MICPRCLLRNSSRAIFQSSTLTRATPPLSQATRPFTTTQTRSSTPINPNIVQTSNEQRSPPAATSTSAAQPFSTPLYPAPGTEGSDIAPAGKPNKSPPPPKPVSCVPAGTPLKGLNYFKNKEDPVALEDHEYPSWLWTSILTDRSAAKAASGEKEPTDPRLFAKSANVRKRANKRARAKEVAREKGMRDGAGGEQVPLYEQSVDLAMGDGTPKSNVEAGEARTELVRAMRAKRRRDIKEANFLKGVR